MHAGIDRPARVGLSALAAVLVGLAGLTLAGRAQQAEAWRLGPYDDLAALQAGTGKDVGFLPDAAAPGFGGMGAGVDITLMLGETVLPCEDAAYEIAAMAGLLVSGKLFCPSDDAAAASAGLDDARARLDGDPAWVLHDDHLSSPRRPSDYGRSVPEAYAFLSGPDAGDGPVTRVPVQTWHHESGARVTLSAALYAKQGDSRFQREVSFAFATACLFQLAVYRRATPDDPESWADADLAPLRALFDDRPFATVPVAERTQLAANYAASVCPQL